MITYKKVRAFEKLTLRLKENRQKTITDNISVNLTKDELDDIIEAMEDYTQTLGDTYGDELYHEQVDRMDYGF